MREPREKLVIEQPGFNFTLASRGRENCPVNGSDTRYQAGPIFTSAFERAAVSVRYNEQQRKQIAAIVTSIDGVANNIYDQGNKAIYYLNSYVEGDSTEVNDPDWIDGHRCAKNMGDLRKLFFGYMDQLILNAPTAVDANRLCDHKIKVQNKANELFNQQLAPMLIKANEAQLDRSKWQQFLAWARGVKNAVVAVINAFIEAIKAAIQVIMDIFKIVMTVGEKLLMFLVNYPKTAAAVAIGSLAGFTGLYYWVQYRAAKAFLVRK